MFLGQLKLFYRVGVFFSWVSLFCLVTLFIYLSWAVEFLFLGFGFLECGAESHARWSGSSHLGNCERESLLIFMLCYGQFRGVMFSRWTRGKVSEAE